MSNNILAIVWISDLLNYVFPTNRLTSNYTLINTISFLSINEYRYYQNYDKDIIFIKANKNYSSFGSKIKDLVFDKLSKRGFDFSNKKFKKYVEKEFFDILIKTDNTNILVEHYILDTEKYDLHCIVLNHDKGEKNE